MGGTSLDKDFQILSYAIVDWNFRNCSRAGTLFCSIRFMLGGDHGKFKYGPPEGHSPVCESLLPRDILTIEPCFHLGDLPKGIVHYRQA